MSRVNKLAEKNKSNQQERAAKVHEKTETKTIIDEKVEKLDNQVKAEVKKVESQKTQTVHGEQDKKESVSETAVASEEKKEEQQEVKKEDPKKEPKEENENEVLLRRIAEMEAQMKAMQEKGYKIPDKLETKTVRKNLTFYPSIYEKAEEMRKQDQILSFNDLIDKLLKAYINGSVKL